MADDTVKISANLSSSVVEALKDVAAAKGVSLTEALRQAISHEKYFVDAARKDQKILIEDSGGAVREVVINPTISSKTRAPA
jgi:hypothetical protein